LSRTSPTKAYTKSGNTSGLGRTEFNSDDDRPFSEIRRTLNDILRMLVLHRWMFLIPFTLVSSGAFIASLSYPRVYKASTVFERQNDPVMMNLPMSAGAAGFKYFRNTMVRDVTSLETVGEVVEKLGLAGKLERTQDGALTHQAKRRRDAVARSLAGTLSVTTSSPSEMIDVIRITYTGPDPDVGARFVEEVKRTYVRRTMKWIHEFLTSQRDYFQREAKIALGKFRTAQRAETELRLAHPFVNPTDPSSIALRESQLELERNELARRKREYAQELSAARQMLAALGPDPIELVSTNDNGSSTSPSVVQTVNPEYLRLRARLATLDAQIRELRDTRGMTDQHPDVQERLAERRVLTDELKRLRAPADAPAAGDNADKAIARANTPVVLAAAPVPALPPSRGVPLSESNRIDRARLTLQAETAEAKLKDVAISLETTETALMQIRKAKSEIGSQQEVFGNASDTVQRAREKHARLERTVSELEPVITAIEQNRLLQFSEGQRARGSRIPVSPKSTTVVLLALVAGLGAGVIFVILAELLDNVYRSSGQVSRSLGLPLLEAIDEIVTGQDRRKMLVKRAFVAPLIVTMCVAVTGLTGSMAYLSINRPWAYEKIRKIPEAALQLFVDIPQNKKG